MDQLKKLFNTLSASQRIGIVLIALAVGAGIVSFVRWRHEADFRPLFTGMAPEDASAIVQKLKESGVEYRLAENGTSVSVPEVKVDEARLDMAGAGLPKTGRVGFELFDKNNLGITDFTEHVNYRRALEGELERSIKAIQGIEQARVHLTFARDSVFLDSREPAKASILVDLGPGVHLSPTNVVAITNLVASAVESLSPDYVSVVDMRGNLLSRPRKTGTDESNSSDTLLDYKHQVEKDLMAKVESTLEPLLGAGKFRVGVTADCDFTTSDQTDEIYDPTRSVMVSSQKSEDLAGSPQSAGVPGTASNLPRPAVRPAVVGTNVSKKTESTAFATTRTVREVKTPRGAIKRISAALLLDQDFRWEGKGARAKRVDIPPTAEKLKAIHDIVAGVIGITPARGDQLVIESLPFEQTSDTEEIDPPAPKPATDPAARLTQFVRTNQIWLGAALLVLIGGAVFLLRRGRGKGTKSAAAQAIQTRDTPASLAAKNAAAGINAGGEPGQAKLPAASPANKMELVRQQVRESVTKDPVLAANVIRGWLEEDPS